MDINRNKIRNEINNFSKRLFKPKRDISTQIVSSSGWLELLNVKYKCAQ